MRSYSTIHKDHSWSVCHSTHPPVLGKYSPFIPSFVCQESILRHQQQTLTWIVPFHMTSIYDHHKCVTHKEKQHGTRPFSPPPWPSSTHLYTNHTVTYFDLPMFPSASSSPSSFYLSPTLGIICSGQLTDQSVCLQYVGGNASSHRKNMQLPQRTPNPGLLVHLYQLHCCATHNSIVTHGSDKLAIVVGWPSSYVTTKTHVHWISVCTT